MAFDHPVEADRVDLSFSSIMARAPVIGSLMYLLGGHHAKEEQEYESSARKEIVCANNDNQPCLMASGSNRKNIKSALKKSTLSLASTDCSEGEDDSFRSALEIHEERSESDFSLRRKKKELSWSDQSGQSLVEYIEHDPSSTTGKETLAIHGLVGGGGGSGGMTRSRSIRTQLEENQLHTRRLADEKSYLPKMTSQGVVMPTMGGIPAHAPANSNGGIDSPQWGWYMNLTPPSPEMYSSHQPLHKKPHTSSSASTASVSSDASVPKRHSTKPNHIFQNLPSQKRDRATRPSLPF